MIFMILLFDSNGGYFLIYM
ncbi:hypothetical protein Taro_002469 [Colocasia esculenta]|uniref:Uncharacterized protein n=1 Tax=Colocasia esculenta TaxID=4460 RepID=A0A843TIT9_COLES|nr:hypothetical protein [Colocasia esculenta]